MESKTKETKEMIKETISVFLICSIIIMHIVTTAMIISSCVCSAEDIDCYEACEQRNITSCNWCFATIITNVITATILLLLWSDKKK